MKIRILESAKADLNEDYRFYESEAEGIGTYFLQFDRGDDITT